MKPKVIKAWGVFMPHGPAVWFESFGHDCFCGIAHFETRAEARRYAKAHKRGGQDKVWELYT